MKIACWQMSGMNFQTRSGRERVWEGIPPVEKRKIEKRKLKKETVKKIVKKKNRREKEWRT